MNASVIVELSCYLLVHGSNNAHRSTLLELIKSNYVCSLSDEKNIVGLAIEEALRLASGQLTESNYEYSTVDSGLLWENISELIRLVMFVFKILSLFK